MEALTVEHLSFRYPETEEDVLKDIGFSVKGGEFVTLCGLSGSGKSTLLRHLKPALTPHGNRSGSIFFDARKITSLSFREQSEKIGFVRQSPDNQIVTDKVWHELSFGLESLGLPQEVIHRRVAETASFFGIQPLFEAEISQLSGGQKQLLNLASVMAMQPEVLLLDEPTSQLDPIAAGEFLACLNRVNRELGVTVIITEHRLDAVLPFSDRVLVLENGEIISDASPARTGKTLRSTGSSCFFSLPTPMRVWDAVEPEGDCPVTVAQGREWLTGYARRTPLYDLDAEMIPPAGKTLVTLKNVWFRYGKDTPDIIKSLSLEVRSGELLTVMGGNGAGKTTLLSIINGENKPYSGKVFAENGVCLTLPQNPQTLLNGKTVWETLNEVLEGRNLSVEEAQRRLGSVIRLCGLQKLLERHPFDLSGGEMQKAALAKLLLLQPAVLLLDEPTKGLDAHFKMVFADILSRLTRAGTAVVMISHDMEFCAKYSHRCVLLFNGELVAGGTPREFFSENSFYVTSAARMSKKLLPQAVTAEDIIFCCTGRREKQPPGDENDADSEPFEFHVPEPLQTKKQPIWKKLLGCLGAVLLLFGVIENLTALAEIFPFWLNFFFIAVPTILLMAVFSRKSKPSEDLPAKKRKLRKRTVAAALMILLMIPLTIYIGVVFLQDQKYLFISLLVLLECMLPFFLVFEGRKPQARELVLIAALCAITVAGRSAFAALPQVKPVLALVIICGAAFGGETGFVIGAASMLASNMVFGQGAWTPWQMFAAGLIGFVAGVLFRKGMLSTSKPALCLFGFLLTILLYGGIMNFSSLVLSHVELNTETVIAFYVQGLPFDVIHAFSTAAFLFFFAEPMLEKLSRIKTKYGFIS